MAASDERADDGAIAPRLPGAPVVPSEKEAASATVPARGAFRALRHKMDPRRVNGGVFLGLDGIVVKSHGGTDALGFASAVDVAYDMVKYALLSKISHALADRGEWVLPGASSVMVEAAEGEAQSAPDLSGSHRTEGE